MWCVIGPGQQLSWQNFHNEEIKGVVFKLIECYLVLFEGDFSYLNLSAEKESQQFPKLFFLGIIPYESLNLEFVKLDIKSGSIIPVACTRSIYTFYNLTI